MCCSHILIKVFFFSPQWRRSPQSLRASFHPHGGGALILSGLLFTPMEEDDIVY
jgi:hypothetical protein